MVYDLMTVFQDVVYLIRPREKTEGSFPFIVPLADEVSRAVSIFLIWMNINYFQLNLTETANNVVIGFNEKLHIATWDFSDSMKYVVVVKF